MTGAERLWYRKPATRWEEVLPLGNGHLGAMVWGSAERETIGLNEGTLWSGYPREKTNPRAAAALPRVRELVFAGEYRKAQELVRKDMLGEYTESFMPLGNLLIDLPGEGAATDYERELTLGDACARVRYQQGGVRYTRELFASYPHRALIMRLTASEPKLNAAFRLQSELQPKVSAQGDTLWLHGQCPEHVDPDYTGVPDPVRWGEKGKRFSAALRVLATDGELRAHDQSLTLTGATFAVLSLTAVENPDLASAYTALGYEGLKAAHTGDYHALYRRVTLDLGEQPDEPTDERLQRLAAGREDAPLYALYFQYGRYLMISASRAGGQPITLQGLWSWQIQPPWSCNYTTNINAQMNYWPALSCGLGECLRPYFDFVQKLCEQGKQTARDYYGCRGFTLGHNTDYWANNNPVGVISGQSEGGEDSPRYACFALASVWVCQELWRYYAYTGDLAFLRSTALPVLREAAQFCVDFLTPHGEYEVICPSTSPENAFYTAEGEIVSVGYASAIDMTLVREAFDEYEQACEALGMEDELLAAIREKRPRLYPYGIGRDGQLMEWHAEFDEPEPGHRHVSHLYGLFPGERFRGDAAMEQACRRSMERRLANGGGHTGWSCAWLINLFAMLGDGEGAFEQLRTLLTRSTAPNLWDEHPPFQIDGNFGGIAGIANMLVQERGGEVVLLPALPKAFATGAVTGLRVKGGKAVDIRWAEGKLVERRIYPAEG